MSTTRELMHQSTMQELSMTSSWSVLDLTVCKGDSNSTSSDEASMDIGSLKSLQFIFREFLTKSTHYKSEGTGNNEEFNVTAYMESRAMTPFQEFMNAVTMIPNPIYCWYYIFSGLWINPSIHFDLSPLVDDSFCIKSIWFPKMSSLPPTTIMAVAIGITLHAPFSFIYHYKYAHSLDSTQRILHWSRRMDHSAIHACVAILSYATSASWMYFLLNIFFNAYCIFYQFQSKVQPRQNQTRVFISILACTLPLLFHGDWNLFARCWLILFSGGYVFVTYPFSGWSHSVFHIILYFLPSLLMESALRLELSQPFLTMAMKCRYHEGMC